MDEIETEIRKLGKNERLSFTRPDSLSRELHCHLEIKDAIVSGRVSRIVTCEEMDTARIPFLSLVLRQMREELKNHHQNEMLKLNQKNASEHVAAMRSAVQSATELTIKQIGSE